MLRALLLISLANALQPVKLPDGFKAPEPKPLQIGESEIPDLLSGAAALAAALAGKVPVDEDTVILLTGGNTDPASFAATLVDT